MLEIKESEGFSQEDNFILEGVNIDSGGDDKIHYRIETAQTTLSRTWLALQEARTMERDYGIPILIQPEFCQCRTCQSLRAKLLLDAITWHESKVEQAQLRAIRIPLEDKTKQPSFRVPHYGPECVSENNVSFPKPYTPDDKIVGIKITKTRPIRPADLTSDKTKKADWRTARNEHTNNTRNRR